MYIRSRALPGPGLLFCWRHWRQGMLSWVPGAFSRSLVETAIFSDATRMFSVTSKHCNCDSIISKARSLCDRQECRKMDCSHPGLARRWKWGGATLILPPVVFGRLSSGFLLLGGPLGLPLHSKYFQTLWEVAVLPQERTPLPRAGGWVALAVPRAQHSFVLSPFTGFEVSLNKIELWTWGSKIPDTVEFYFAAPYAWMFSGLQRFAWLSRISKRWLPILLFVYRYTCTIELIHY